MISLKRLKSLMNVPDFLKTLMNVTDFRRFLKMTNDVGPNASKRLKNRIPEGDLLVCVCPHSYGFLKESSWLKPRRFPPNVADFLKTLMNVPDFLKTP